jgi:ribosomal protein S1
MMLRIKAALLLALISIVSLGHVLSFKYLNQQGRYIRPSGLRTVLRMSDSTDFAEFEVGQEYEGKLIKAMPFGIFVDISKGTNVLLPRSVLSKGTYEKLKAKADANANDLIKLQLVSVSAENKTISGKFIPENYVARSDISSLQGKDFNSKTFNATVVSAHEFGVFAEIDEYGVEGLIPTSKLGSFSGSYTEAFPAGSSINVMVVEMNAEKKKLVLSLVQAQQEGGAMSGVEENTWMQAIVQSVTAFGLFVRPAGYETVGLVHRSQVPRELISALKGRTPIPTGLNKTDVEALFGEGDVIKVRVKAASNDKGKLELSMLPYKADENEEDDYVVEGRDAEGEEFKPEYNEDDNTDSYDAQDTLLWWKGQPYVKTEMAEAAVDEEIGIISESTDLVEGTWRRMFELDLRADQLDFSSKPATSATLVISCYI